MKIHFIRLNLIEMNMKFIDYKSRRNFAGIGEEQMARRGGFTGMPGNMGNLMKQAQKMQKQMEEQAKEMETREFTGTAGGGAVSVTVSGKKEVTKVTLQKDAVDPDDVEMLEDLIMAATNEALHQMEEANQNALGRLTGGLGAGLGF